MKKINTAALSGMQELLPHENFVFSSLQKKLAQVYATRGFVSIETPVIERASILLAKAGGDTEKQIYFVRKTGNTDSLAKVPDEALRFDHTVPLARYVVEHESALSFPFKVTQMGRNFRGERAQKGRFREFYQCDVDVIGRGNLPIEYDAEVLSTLYAGLKSFQISTPVLARVSNRKILSGFFAFYGISEVSSQILNIIDHAEKVPEAATQAGLSEVLQGALTGEADLTEHRGFSVDEMVEKILTLISLSGERAEVVPRLRGLGISNEEFNAGVNELDYVLSLFEMENGTHAAIVDMKIVRGLDYYTGTVFEFVLPEYKELGSIAGGGRYENLAEYFSDAAFPGVGGSIGLTRLFYVLRENGLIDMHASKPVDIMVVPFSSAAAEISFAMKVAAELRDSGKTVSVLYSARKLGDRLKYAAANANAAIVIGENEVKSGKYEIKNFR